MRVACLVLALLAALGGCRPRAVTSAAPSGVDPLTGGTLVFEDSFDGSGIGPEWRSEGDHWSIMDGWLAVEGARNDALWLTRPLPDAVRVEFVAKSLSPEGDIKFEIFGDGRTHESGYIAIFGGWRNALNIIARLDEHGDDRLVGQDGVRVEPERVYRFAAVRTDARFQWFVDGQPFLTFDDATPLVGDGHRHFAFNNWTVPLRFDDLRVFDLSAP
jgi:hypothetical protein